MGKTEITDKVMSEYQRTVVSSIQLELGEADSTSLPAAIAEKQLYVKNDAGEFVPVINFDWSVPGSVRVTSIRSDILAPSIPIPDPDEGLSHFERWLKSQA